MTSLTRKLLRLKNDVKPTDFGARPADEPEKPRKWFDSAMEIGTLIVIEVRITSRMGSDEKPSPPEFDRRILFHKKPEGLFGAICERARPERFAEIMQSAEPAANNVEAVLIENPVPLDYLIDRLFEMKVIKASDIRETSRDYLYHLQTTGDRIS